MKQINTIGHIAYDKNGQKLQIGDSVIMPEPNDTDGHMYECTAYIKNILSNGNCIVQDGDDDCFEIEGYRLEYNND